MVITANRDAFCALVAPPRVQLPPQLVLYAGIADARPSARWTPWPAPNAIQLPAPARNARRRDRMKAAWEYALDDRNPAKAASLASCRGVAGHQRCVCFESLSRAAGTTRVLKKSCRAATAPDPRSLAMRCAQTNVEDGAKGHPQRTPAGHNAGDRTRHALVSRRPTAVMKLGHRWSCLKMLSRGSRTGGRPPRCAQLATLHRCVQAPGT